MHVHFCFPVDCYCWLLLLLAVCLCVCFVLLVALSILCRQSWEVASSQLGERFEVDAAASKLDEDCLRRAKASYDDCFKKQSAPSQTVSVVVFVTRLRFIFVPLSVQAEHTKPSKGGGKNKRKGGGKNTYKDRSNTKCHNCGGTGHWARECHNKKQKGGGY